MDRYEEAKEILDKTFSSNGFSTKLKSLANEEKGKNRDIQILYNGKRIAGIYVAKDFYNMSLDDETMLANTSLTYEVKAKGRMRCKFDTLQECIDEIKKTGGIK